MFCSQCNSVAQFAAGFARRKKICKDCFSLSLCLFFCFLLGVLNNGRCAVEGGNVKRTGSGVEWRLSGLFAKRRLTWKSTWLSRDPSPADGRRKKKKRKRYYFIYIYHTHTSVSRHKQWGKEIFGSHQFCMLSH